jgi:hypothetical protein
MLYYALSIMPSLIHKPALSVYSIIITYSRITHPRRKGGEHQHVSLFDGLFGFFVITICSFVATLEAYGFRSQVVVVLVVLLRARVYVTRVVLRLPMRLAYTPLPDLLMQQLELSLRLQPRYYSKVI